MNYVKNTTILLLAALTTTGCIADDTDSDGQHSSGTETSSSATEPNPPTGAFGRTGLLFDTTCDAILDEIKTIALTEVTPWGLESDYWILEEESFMEVEESVGASEMSDASADSSRGDFSETNTQEVGVDEGDILETDGIRIFRASSNQLDVIDVETLGVTDSVILPDGTHNLVLHDGQLAVVSNLWQSWDTTHIRVFTVTEDGRIELQSTETLDGRTVGVRSVNGHLRILLETSNRDQLGFVSPWEDNLTEEEALEHNIEQIERSTIDQWMPRVFQDGVTNSALNCSQIAISEQSPTAQTTTWVATRNIHRNETTQGQLGIMSRADTMYATANSIHFTTTAWNSDVEWPQQPGPKTSVHSFSFNTNDTMYHLASGAIPGETIGQFALNEHGDELRIATTRNVDGISESAVTILTAGDNRTYNVLGEVGGLGLTERIYAVRYIGDLAYVVTFRETDPLYVVDLTDPTQPFAAGELKIPGYSSYLHPIADGKLLGIGQDADDRGRTLGTQLSLFDVSDSTNPLRLDKVDIGGASAAEYDHRAFLWWPAGEFTATADYDGTVTVTRMSELQTFAEPVELEHPMSEDCRWWNSTTRALVIGNQIVTIDATHIAKYDLETLRMTEASSYVESTETDSETGDNASISEPSMEPMC